MAGSRSFLLVLLLGVSFAHLVASIRIEHEKQHTSVKEHWTKLRPLEDDAVIPVRIALAQRNLDHGTNLLHAVSDPDSSQYGQHLSIEQVAKLFEPSIRTIETVREWLESETIDLERMSLPASKQWMRISMSGKELGNLVNATYYYWSHKDSGDVSIASDSYTLPKHVASHVEFIHPGSHPSLRQGRSELKAKNKAKRSLSQRDELPPRRLAEAITPQNIMDIYGVNDTLERNPQNKFGVYAIFNVYRQKTLDNFFEKFAKWIPKGTTPIYNKINGAISLSNAEADTDEAELDLQTAYPLVYPDPLAFYQVDDFYNARLGSQSYEHGIFNDFLDAVDGSYCNYSAFGITGNSPKFDPTYPNPRKGGYKGTLQCGVYKPPNVISFSYHDGEPYLPVTYQKRQCNEWMKLGLMGVTVMFATGDYGVGSLGCYPQTKPHSPFQAFASYSPANCPWLTTVGGTKIPYGSKPKRGNEVAAFGHIYSSGAGFSNIYPTPKYQKKALETYLSQNPPPFPSYETKDRNTAPKYSNGTYVGAFNRAGRAYPDVAALGQNYTIYSGDKLKDGQGTSMSAPLFAGIIHRINNKRLLAGKSTVGFVNPVLYQNPDVLNDITEGSNPACLTPGFKAAKGWDPVTGLGTPNYPELLALFMGLP